MSRGPCIACVVVMINGVRCHEHGCPEAWRDRQRECRWCGQPFRPDHRHQRDCGPECQEAML